MIKKSIFVLLFFCAGSISYGQTPAQNQIKTWEAVAPVTDLNSFMTMPVRDVKQSTQFFDALGRPLQTVIKQGSPLGKDVVSFNTYDRLGREAQVFLPFVSEETTGEIKTDLNTQQSAFYAGLLNGQNENFLYSKNVFDASPENRTVLSLAPGNNWVGSNRGIEMHYFNNVAADAVRIFEVQDQAIGEFGIYSEPQNGPALYDPGTLIKTITQDEHGSQVIEFKNKNGQVVLKKVQLSATADDGTGSDHYGWLCTYYIYDAYGNLRAVLPPKATNEYLSSGFSTTMLNELCFRYEYDERNRMVKKQVPGAEPVSMVYDKRDRLVLTQDGNLKSKGQWLYTLYDNLNRPVETGLWDNSDIWDTLYVHAYDAVGYPDLTNESHEVLTQNFYNDYSWTANIPNSPFGGQKSTLDDNSFYTPSNQYPYPQPLEQSPMIKGMLTGTKVKVIGTSDFLYSANYYDSRGRVIQQVNTNAKGGKDINTTQYSFSGQVLQNAIRHIKEATDTLAIIVFSKPIYDAGGRQIRLQKRIVGSNGMVKDWRTTFSQTYNELGQLKNKDLSITESSCNPNSPTSCELNTYTSLTRLDYDYNIRGWLLGINRPYVQGGATSANGYFGFELAYDKPGSVVNGSSYVNPAYNGNIAGTTWKMKGDGIQRKYDFGYDKANRLMNANFLQFENGSWSHDRVNYDVKMGDGTDPVSAYDDNGNIKGMQQWGYKAGINGSISIDSLTYQYYDKSNKLSSVSDANMDNASKLGDFMNGSNQDEDYVYDNNGNLSKDGNKNISNISYNYLNLPRVIDVTGKGTIEYIYDATGNKLSKTVNETGKPPRTTTFIGPFVYENDTLQFISHEEGRIRFKPGFTSADSAFVFDYFLKDHLGNVRMVLTEEKQIDKYPVASLEDAKVGIEEQYYSINASKIVSTNSMGNSNKPQEYVNDNGIGNNPEDSAFSAANSEKMYKLKGDENPTGLGITLKVMAGDKLDIFGKSYWYENNTGGSSANTTIPIIDLLSGFLNSPGAPASTGLHGLVTPPTINTTVNTGGIQQMFTEQNNQTDPYSQVPKAYINYLFFDEQFKCVGSGFSKVRSGANPNHETKDHYNELQNIVVPKNGFLYIYCSNESPVAVFFDNLQVVHSRGAVLEETNYYPFGLTMAGISSQAAGIIENNNKYNGIEFDKDLELNIYEADLRDLDAQIGRWWQIDPKVDEMYEWSTYTSNFDNPIRYKDPLGDEPDGECCGELWKALSDAGNKIMISASGVLWGSLNTATGGLVSTDPFNVRPGLNGEEKMYWDNAVTVGQVSSMLPVPGHTAGEPTPVGEFAPAGRGKGTFKPGITETPASTSNTKQIKGEQTGSYTNTHESGKTYSGKGPESRAKQSADRVAKENNDPSKKTDWAPSKNNREAFKAEDKRIQENGGANNHDKNYNKINSPGKKYNEQDKGRGG